mgnify:CR=1 FL=1
MEAKYHSIEHDESPIGILDLSLRYYNALRRHSINTIQDLVSLISRGRLHTVKSMGDVGRNEVITKLEQYASVSNSPIKNIKSHKTQGTTDNTPFLKLDNPNKSVELLKIKDRSWKILRLRSLGATLEEIAQEIGVTRERVRQIEKYSTEKFHENTYVLIDFFDFLEKNENKLFLTVENNETINIATKKLVNLSLNYEGGQLLFENAEKIVILLRTFSKSNNDEEKKRWVQIIFKACSIHPYIKENEKTIKKIEELKERNRRYSYTELAYKVLDIAGRPLHWKEIAEKAEALKRRKNFNTAAIYNMLQGKKDVFVRVEAGTYGLAEWGVKESEYYTDIIASVLSESGKALSFGAVYQRVHAIRKIEKTSLLMFLDLNPRFYRSKSNTYGLRAWLPPRYKQTLLTPSHLIEDAKSFERVAKAIERGYDVDEIINRDRQEEK